MSPPQEQTPSPGAGDPFARKTPVPPPPVDASGYVVAAGSRGTPNGNDFLVVKVAGASGAEVWRTIVNGTGSDDFADEFVAGMARYRGRGAASSRPAARGAGARSRRASAGHSLQGAKAPL